MQRERIRVLKRNLGFAVFALAFLAMISGTARGAEVARATLKNGLRAIVVRNTLAPVVTTEMNYLVGSNEAPAGFPGMAHALEHMMFRGSPGLSAAQLSTVSAAMGGEFNAATQQTVTQYFFTIPADSLEIALRIEAIRMQAILATEPVWKQERGAIEQEVAQDLSNPQYVFYMRLLDAMFRGTPYAHDALGTRESFQRTTAAMLRDFHRSWYTPNNAILIIVGNVEPDATLAMVRKIFEAVPARPLSGRPPVQLGPLQAERIAVDTDLAYGTAVVAYRLPGYESPDFAAGQVLADVLDSRRGNLFALVPEGKALFAGFNGTALPKAAMGYAMAGFPSGGDGETLVVRLKAIMADYVKNGVPAELVEAAKQHEVADAEFQKNSMSGLAAAWSQAVAVERRQSPEDDIEAIKRVTAADVDRVARECLVNESAVTAILTPRPSGAPVTAKAGNRQESFAPKQTKPVRPPAWARSALALPAEPGRIADPFVAVLPNGLRLIIQPENTSPTVSVIGQVKTNADLQEPPGKEGVAEVLEALFTYGSRRLDRLEFQKALDAIAANESAGTKFSLQVLAEHFDEGLGLLAENLLSPALPEEAFTTVREETKSEVAGRLESPGYLSKRALRAALYPKGDPTLRQATPDTIAALTLDDVKSYYGQVFRPDMTTIVVIGQIHPDRAKAAIARAFGAWSASGPKPLTDLPPVPPNAPGATVVPNAARVQDEVTLAATVGITRKHPDYYPLQVGNRILSGGAFDSRLFRHLREESGLVYSVDALLDAGKTRSLFAAFYACDPPNVSKARAMVEHDLRQMQRTVVTPGELERAKLLLVRQIPLSAASRDSIAGILLQLVAKELPLDEPTRAARRYLTVTAAEVKAAFAKWIRPNSFVQVTLGPPPE